MSSKILDLIEGKSGGCETNNPLEQCSQELTNPNAQLVRSEPSQSAGKVLNGFSIDSTTATEASITAASSALVIGLSGAGYRGAAIGTEKFAAVVAEVPFKVAGMIFGADPMAVSQITQKVINEPFGPRMLSTGLKAGAYGAAIGLTGYGLYKGYEYLSSEKP